MVRPRKEPRPRNLWDKIYWKNGSYHWHFIDPDTKKQRSTVVVKNVPYDRRNDQTFVLAANEKVQELELEMKTQGHFIDRKMSFPDAWQDYLAYKTSIRKLKVSTIADYTSIYDCYLEPFFGKLKVGEITEHRLGEFLRRLDSKVAKGTRAELHKRGKISAKRRNNIVLVAKSWLTWCHKRNPPLLTVNLGKNLAMLGTPDYRKSVVKVPDYDDLMKVLAALPEMTVVRTYKVPVVPKRARTSRKQQKAPTTHHYCYRPLVETALYTGMRAGELVGLEWPAVNFDSEEITVHQSFTHGALGDPKSGHERRIPIPNRVLDILEEWSRICPSDIYVFPSETGRRLSIDNFRKRVWDKATAEAGIPGTRIHQLRSTYISWMVELGLNPAIVQEIAGHESWSTTQIYLGIREKSYQTVRDTFNAPVPKKKKSTKVVRQPARGAGVSVPAVPNTDAAAPDLESTGTTPGEPSATD